MEAMPGKGQEVLLALTAILAHGHVLIEDVPGMGKTTLVRFLGQVLGLNLKRVQFTNDLLPADILGVSIYRPETREFHFRAGPVFTTLLLADELNRAPPKTQSALLQAMEERFVSIEGVNHTLDPLFTVMATQNPRGMSGTFALPESQLDRFLLKFAMGLPGRDAEKALLQGSSRKDFIEKLAPLTTPTEIAIWQNEVQATTATEAVIDYILRLLNESRQRQDTRALSPRAGIDILRAARAWAWINNRHYVLPEDIQFIFPSVTGHRLPMQEAGCTVEYNLAREILNKVAIV
jgi:MoxR-like ATPase